MAIGDTSNGELVFSQLSFIFFILIMLTLPCYVLGLINATIHITKALAAGENLPSLLKRNHYYEEVAKMHKNKMASGTLLLFRNTINMLMTKGYTICSEESDSHPGVVYHKALRTFWIGFHERSHHFSEKIVHGIIPGYENHRIKVSQILFQDDSCLYCAIDA